MNYFRMYPGDYLRDTSHLTPLQHGCFLLLLLNYYARGKPIPSDKPSLYRIASAVSAEEQQAVDDVASEFFQKHDGKLFNKKSDELLAIDAERVASAKRSANARWNRCERNASALETHMRTQCYPAPAPAPAPAPSPEPKEDKKAFIKPSHIEVTEYAKSIGFNLDGEYFVDKYDGNGWKVGNSKMKDWKAVVRTWKKSPFSNNGKSEAKKIRSIDDYTKEGL